MRVPHVGCSPHHDPIDPSPQWPASFWWSRSFLKSNIGWLHLHNKDSQHTTHSFNATLYLAQKIAKYFQISWFPRIDWECEHYAFRKRSYYITVLHKKILHSLIARQFANKLGVRTRIRILCINGSCWNRFGPYDCDQH